MNINDYLQVEGYDVLEEDEQQLSIESSKEDVHEGRQAYNDLVHLNAMEATLSGFQTALENHEQLSSTEKQLIAASSNLTAVGDSISDVSLESADDVSLEGLGEVIKKIWQSIVNAVKRVWDAIMSFFGKVKDQTGRIKKLNENMRDRMSKIAGKKSSAKSVKLERDAQHLYVDGKPPKDAEDILTLMDRASKHGEVVFKDYSQRLVSVGGNLIKALDNFDLEKPEDSLNTVAKASEDLNFDAIQDILGKEGATETTDKRFEGRRVLVSKPLPNNKSLFFIGSKAAASENNVLATSEKMRVRQLLFRKTHDKKQPSDLRVDISPLTSADGIKMYQTNKQLIDMVAEYDKIKDDLNKLRRDLEKAGQRLQRRADDAGADIPDNTSVYVKEALHYVSAYGTWAFNPVVDYASQLLSSVRAVISVCNKSAETYS